MSTTIRSSRGGRTRGYAETVDIDLVDGMFLRMRKIQLRNVPNPLLRKLKARAALAGMSLSDYLLAELQQIAESPTMEELESNDSARLSPTRSAMSDVSIRIQPTPNPNSLLFHVDRTVTKERMKQFNSAAEANGVPLAMALFAIENVTTIFFMPNSITVSKDPAGDWDEIAPAAEEAIREHFASA